ncbi:NAD(P)-binding domain-containing protein [[Mycobacterium] burgundiense]|uniref:NAD(P)-binding domain-containing protein n=1 Tax=[Mycobacterium] burgundiense TaxID=3064286 RepID=A0ABM9LI21_9MYCO|nr:NAD(P)-binding domain-containing protein [Mycolicibacterium sp. MU0053]CAJ1499422.1 NAD(P)-binding domain-containing protein [Mycolicibacterium sp. MU0053]
MTAQPEELVSPFVDTDSPAREVEAPAAAGGIAPRAGVIGLGMIGGGVAVSLEARGRIPVVHDVRGEAAADLGLALAAPTPAEVAAVSDVVLIAVVDAAQVREVLRGGDGVLAGARPGLIVALLSTLAVPEVLDVAEECRPYGVAVLDCGVTPGDQAASNGMVAMVGGDDDTVRRAMPVLSDFAKKVVHCGPLGAGMATKIARNVLTYGTWRAAHEAAELARAAGVDPRTLIEVVEDADPTGSTMFTWLRTSIDAPELATEAGPQVLHLMDKDLAAAQDLAAKSGVEVPLIDAARDHAADTLGIVVDRPAADRTERGLQTMDKVYGTGLAAHMPEERTPATAMTIDHLFGEIWSRPGLSLRDRRLVVLGATAMLGRADLIEVQVRGALINGELTEDELEEIVLQLHYYAGWGNGTAVQAGVNAALQSWQGGYVAPGESS